MCLVIASGPFVAKEDIPVFKTLQKGGMMSVYRNFVYMPHTLYPEVTFGFGHAGDINQGYHSFARSNIRLELDRRDNSYAVTHNQWCEVVWLFPYETSDKPMLFTIPKGATYYVGQNGDLVSNRIRSGSLKPVRRLRDLPLRYR